MMLRNDPFFARPISGAIGWVGTLIVLLSTPWIMKMVLNAGTELGKSCFGGQWNPCITELSAVALLGLLALIGMAAVVILTEYLVHLAWSRGVRQETRSSRILDILWALIPLGIVIGFLAVCFLYYSESLRTLYLMGESGGYSPEMLLSPIFYLAAVLGSVTGVFWLVERLAIYYVQSMKDSE